MPTPLVAGATALGGLSAYSQQKQQKKQNAANMAAFERQHALEKEQDLRNREGVMSLLQRPFERSVMTPQSQRLFLGGLNEQARALSEQIMVKQAEYEALKTVDGTAPEDGGALMAEIRELTAQKDSVEFQALSDARSQYSGLVDQADLTGQDIFTGALAARQQAAYDPMQSLRGELDPFRQQANVGFEAAEKGIYDLDEYAAGQALALERVQATDDPPTRDLRLEATDFNNLAKVQDLRRQQAEGIIAGGQQTYNEMMNREGAGRVYGGSSTVGHGLQAAIGLQTAQAASRARLGAEMQNAQEAEAWRQSRIQALMMNQADSKGLEDNVFKVRMDNEGQRRLAQREQNMAGLDALQRSFQTSMQGKAETMQTADEQRQLAMQSEALKLANLNLPSDLAAQRQGQLLATENAQQNMFANRSSAMAPFKVGGGNYMPPTVPTKKVTAGGLGIFLAAAGPAMQGMAANSANATAFKQQKKLIKLRGQYGQGGGYGGGDGSGSGGSGMGYNSPH